ncbi:MAG: hypothetical protein M3367_19190 [Acidobacteriota bacterium]|nr:hypothetical protein [Acidobacteriota bacterium]
MNFENCSVSSDALFSLIEEIKLSYQPSEEVVKRGRKPDFSPLSFLLLTVVAVVTKTFSDSELHRFLEKDSGLQTVLDFSRVPHRTQIMRRLKSLVPDAEEQISKFGKRTLIEVPTTETNSEVSAVDGRMYQALGPKWHKKHRQQGVIPAGLRNVDVESSWSTSNYRQWVQGYRIVVQTLVFPAPVPLFAVWRENSQNEAKIAFEELEKGRLQITDVMLGDTTFGKADFVPEYEKAGGYVLTPNQLPKQNRSWKNDLYEYRRETIELLFQRIIQAFDVKQCLVKGKGKNGAFILASVWSYQICWLNNFKAKKNPAAVKEHIENARLRLKL